jgi:hypothetical protein
MRSVNQIVSQHAAELTRSAAPRRWSLGVGCALVGLVVTFFTARGFAADAGEAGLFFGQQLGAFENFSGRATDVVLNGQRLTLHTSTVQRSVSEVLREFVGVCHADSAPAAAEFAASIADGRKADSELAAIQRMLVMRDQRGELEGTSLCFAGLGEDGLPGVVSRFERFARELDVSELGALRYLYARKTQAGTHVIFVTAPDSLALGELMPADGKDAKGVEPIAGARPKDAVRFLSAQLAGAAHGFTAYRTTRPAAETLLDYAEQVRASGYEVLDFRQLSRGEQPAALGEGVDLRVMRRGERILIATSMPSDGGSLLSVVHL